MNDGTGSEHHYKNRKSVPLLGVDVTPLEADEVVDVVLEHIAVTKPLLVGNLNLHGVYMFHTNEQFAQFCGLSDLVLIDGAPIAWAARERMSRRVGSTDWVDALMPRASGVRILAIGGTPEASAAAEKHMQERYPSVRWVAVDGYSCHKPDELLHAAIEDSQLVLVGMGMPLQERWIIENQELLKSKVVANVGGCFDYYAGAQQLAPRWMGSLGLEWLYRLALSPSRLADRYLVEPFRLARVLARLHVKRALKVAYSR